MSLVIPTTPFERVAVRYIRHQSALGKQFRSPKWVLCGLARSLNARGAEDLDAEQFEAWRCERAHMSPTSQRALAMIVRRLCLYRRRTEPDCFVPDPLHFPRRAAPVTPVILGGPEVARMLAAVDALPPQPQFPLRRSVLRIAIILLYTTGLRLGELARLTLADIDLRQRTLCIRASKFHKTRLVPLSVSTARALRRYLQERLAAPWDLSLAAPLLGHHHGCVRFRGYLSSALGRALSDVFVAAHIHGPLGQRPRVHDFRHSFAVQALLRWYRAGANVQAKLPQLSMYLGHVSISSTAYYLHFVPQIAAAAHRRFARHFGPLAQGGAR